MHMAVLITPTFRKQIELEFLVLCGMQISVLKLFVT